MGSLTNNGTKISASDVSEAEISISAPYDAPNSDERNERTSRDGASIALPAHVAGSGALDRLIDTARDWNARTEVVHMDLHRFRSGLLRAILALKETGYGSDTQRRVQA
jgi:hypothetical protein